MKIIKATLICLAALTLSNCASIAGDNSRAIHVNSVPAGAAIYVDNQQYGITPTTITLPSYIYGGKNVTVKKKGFQDQSAIVNTKFQPIAILDILFLPALVIDGATGNLVKVDPANTTLNYTLEKA